MAKVVCTGCFFNLELPPQVSVANVPCPRCRGVLALAAVNPVATAVSSSPPTPRPAASSTPKAAAKTRPATATNASAAAPTIERSRPSEKTLSDNDPTRALNHGAPPQAGMSLGVKVALIGLPILGLVVTIVAIIASSGPSGSTASPSPMADLKGKPSDPVPEGDKGPSERPPLRDPLKVQQVQFLGAIGQGRRFAIIADRSSSMNSTVRTPGAAPRSSMQCLHDELIKTLQSMERGSYFYVSFFSTSVVPMPRGDTWAEGGGDLTDVITWVRGIKPSGGTNPLPGFVKVFALDPPPDVIFFMTDGGFADVTAQIAKMNERLPKKAPIHTIHFQNTSVKAGGILGNRPARLMEGFDLPGPVHAQFALHAKAAPLKPVGPAKAMGRHKQMEDIAAASGGTFRVYGADEAKGGAAKLAPVLAVHGDLTATDPLCAHRPGCHAKTFEVSLKAGTLYQIDMVGDMDPFLCLADASGRLVASNDNAGGSLNSLIIYRPTVPGVYRIHATSNVRGRTGAFAVTVIDQPF